VVSLNMAYPFGGSTASYGLLFHPKDTPLFSQEQSTTFDNVRHEAVYIAVMTSDEGHHPLFCQRYPTRTCVAGNGEVRSSWNNVASSTRRMAAKTRADAVIVSTKTVGS
jgi:hypothetical protein